MSDILQDLSEPGVVAAIEENGFELFRLFRDWPRAKVYDGPGLLYTLTDLPVSVFNCVLHARLERRAVHQTIDEAIARCQARNVPMLWIVGPSTRPVNLGEHLLARGFLRDGDEPQLAVDLRALNRSSTPPPSLAIELVHDAPTLTRWCRVFTDGFGMPASTGAAWRDLYASIGLGSDRPLRHYLGTLGGKPVATLSLLLAGGVAGIYDVATASEARRQGIATAMVLTALRDACALGYRIGVLGASEKGAGVYRRLGFRLCCTLSSYLWTPTA